MPTSELSYRFLWQLEASPVAALEAMLDAQAALAMGMQPLQLTVGIHEGPCLAVTLNERLDYFGFTVNDAPFELWRVRRAG